VLTLNPSGTTPVCCVVVQALDPIRTAAISGARVSIVLMY